MDLTQINYLSTSVAGVVGFVLGAVWYAPFTFGPLWLRYNPHALEDAATPQRLKRYGVALISSWVQAYALAFLLAAMAGPVDLAHAMLVGGVAWLGFTAAPSLADILLSRRTFVGQTTRRGPSWWLDIGHRLLVTAGIAFVIGVW